VVRERSRRGRNSAGMFRAKTGTKILQRFCFHS
jgi:hypothetical protein